MRSSSININLQTTEMGCPGEKWLLERIDSKALCLVLYSNLTSSGYTPKISRYVTTQSREPPGGAMMVDEGHEKAKLEHGID